MQFSENDLNGFVEKSDALGGPDSPATVEFWRDFIYLPSSVVDVSLRPDSSDYMEQMLCLYREISGRTIDQKLNEHTNVDINSLVHRESPYAFQPPKERVKHYLRLGMPLDAAAIDAGAEFLDMGCGWGLSSEFLAQLGFNVTAIDINPLFIELVRRRAKRLGLAITSIESDFDSYSPGAGRFDAILFYECFHHAMHPAFLLKNVESMLKSDGKLILAGEPIQDHWWPNWGLRLDPLSIYCIRKFGWFESGWSESYLTSILIDANLLPIFYNYPSPLSGRFAIAKRRWCIEGRELHSIANESEWWFEGDWLVSNRAGNVSSIKLPMPKDAKTVNFEIFYFGSNSLEVIVHIGGGGLRRTMQPAGNVISFSLGGGATVDSCLFQCTPWRPSVALGTSDERAIGFHLKSIFYS